jgi:hypothetical protein
MKKRIREMAGRIWKTLAEQEHASVSRLPQLLKENGEIVYQALGWLLKEGKVDFHKKGGENLRIAQSRGARNI